MKTSGLYQKREQATNKYNVSPTQKHLLFFFLKIGFIAVLIPLLPWALEVNCYFVVVVQCQPGTWRDGAVGLPLMLTGRAGCSHISIQLSSPSDNNRKPWMQLCIHSALLSPLTGKYKSAPRMLSKLWFVSFFSLACSYFSLMFLTYKESHNYLSASRSKGFSS